MGCLFVPALVCCALVGVSSAAQTFKEVSYLYKSEGKDKGHLVDGALVLDTSRVAFQSKTTALDIPIASITNIRVRAGFQTALRGWSVVRVAAPIY